MASNPPIICRDSTEDVATARRRAALDFLTSRINFERAPVLPYGQRHLKLDRMRQLLTRLGSPDAGMPIVHVAGTKGKGSTSTLIAGVLRAAGYDVGQFSSPHLENVEERFAVNGHPCSADELSTLVERIRPVAQAMDREAASSASGLTGPTYFELTTALALLHFAERGVDLAVLEVGLGGRLDSTNVCQPAVTVITSISFDHTKQLGSTLDRIAAEKAGIIKPGVPVVCGPVAEAPRRVIAEAAQAHGCRLMTARRDFDYDYDPPQALDQTPQCGRLSFHGNFADGPVELTDLPLRLVGAHQAANAAVALASIEELRRQGWFVSTDAIRTGLAESTLPARLEVIGRDPAVVLDAAHNVASAGALVNALRASFRCTERLLVLAVSRDKDVRGMVRVLIPHFRHVVVTEYRDNPRAVTTAELGQIVRDQWRRMVGNDEGLRVEEIAKPQAAWRRARESARPDQLLCVTGSFFIAAELRAAMIADAQSESTKSVSTRSTDTCEPDRWRDNNSGR